MDGSLAASDSLADVRHRAPALSTGAIDFGLLSELTGFSVKLTWLLGRALLARELGDPGITPHRYSLLEIIGRNPGLQQMQLAATLAITRPATTMALDFWEDRGCVERRTLTGDRRSFGVYATPRGQDELERLRPFIRRADEAITAQLTQAEAAELRRLLSKIHL